MTWCSKKEVHRRPRVPPLELVVPQLDLSAMWRSLDRPKIRPELRQLAKVVQPEATEVLEFLISLPPTQSSGSHLLGLRLHQAEEVQPLLVEEVHDGGRCAEKNKRMANKLRKAADQLSPGDWICIVNQQTERCPDPEGSTAERGQVQHMRVSINGESSNVL